MEWVFYQFRFSNDSQFMAAKKSAKETTPKKVAKKSPAKAVKKPAAKKASAEKAEVKKEAPIESAAANVAKKEAKAPKKSAPKKSAARKNSLGGAPPPPAPVKPKFVPPTADAGSKPSSGTGSHTAAFVKKQEQRLEELRDSLMESMTGMTRETMEGGEAAGNGEHTGDAGADSYDRDFALSMLSKEQDALYEVEQALFRIKTETYGICEISGHKIPTMRLEALPFARLTVECQADWEKEYGNRRFKPSSEVGFSGGIPQEDENSVTVSLDGDDD